MLLSELILYFHRLKDIYFFNLKTVFACKPTAVTSPMRADVEKHVLRQPNTAIKSMQLFTQSWAYTCRNLIAQLMKAYYLVPSFVATARD